MDAPLSTKSAFLAALARGPGYGTELIARVEKLCGMQISEGSAYPALAALEWNGLIKRRHVQTSTRACYYELTAEGRRTFADHRRMVLDLFKAEEE